VETELLIREAGGMEGGLLGPKMSQKSQKSQNDDEVGAHVEVQVQEVTEMGDDVEVESIEEGRLNGGDEGHVGDAVLGMWQERAYEAERLILKLKKGSKKVT